MNTVLTTAGQAIGVGVKVKVTMKADCPYAQTKWYPKDMIVTGRITTIYKNGKFMIAAEQFANISKDGLMSTTCPTDYIQSVEVITEQ
jgi:hypothetical protein